jgi:hypothetical protein
MSDDEQRKTAAWQRIFDDDPVFEVVENYVAPPMTEERVMWFGRGMRGQGPITMDEPTQKFRIGAYIFKDPISWDDDGNYVVNGVTLTPKEVFALVQAEYRRMWDELQQESDS